MSSSIDRPWSDRELHFVGIGGAGMSGLAIIAKRLGARVTGSDGANSPYLPLLEANGIIAEIGHDGEQVPEGAELVISGAISYENPERAIARLRGQRELHRADLLAELTRIKPTIAVTGTHGKTTTSAMIVHALRENGHQPSFVIGAEVRLADQTTNALWDEGEYLVVEADESDRSLLKLSADIAVLTNAELDHHTTYSSLDDIYQTFAEFLGSAESAVVLNQPELVQLVAKKQRLVTFDTDNPVAKSIDLRFPGIHNVCNAMAAVKVGELIGIPAESSVRSLTTFAGTGRRFDRVGETGSKAIVIDDYAHHPTEVRATIEAAKSLSPNRVVAVFQPHLYSRTKHSAAEFAQALSLADMAIVTDIYPARELASDYPGISGETILNSQPQEEAEGQDGGAPGASSSSRDRGVLQEVDLRDGEVSVEGEVSPIANQQATIRFIPDLESAAQILEQELCQGDICLTLGAGNIDDLARRLVVK